MFYLKKVLSTLILPPIGLLIVAWFGLWLARRHRRSGHALVFCALLLLTVLSLPPVAAALRQGLERYPPISAQNLTQAQAIVILGGGIYRNAPEYGGDTVSGSTLERIRYGVFLQRRTGLPILVTGGAPSGGTPEGLVMKAAIEGDYKGSVKWVEAESNDTAGNATYSARILKAAGVTRIALVSHSWHLNRATELFVREGIEVLPAPTIISRAPSSPFAELLPSGGALMASSGALHEWLGILVQRATK